VIVASNGLVWDKGALSRITGLAGKVLVMIGCSFFSVGLGEGGVLATLSGWSFVLGAFAMAMSYAIWLTRTSLPGEIEARADDIVVRRGGGQRVVKKKNIASAYVVNRTIGGVDYPTVEIELRSGTVLAARMREAKPAHELVAALGFGPGGKRVRVSLARPTRRLLNPFVGSFAYVIGSMFATLTIGVAGAFGSQAGGTTFATWLLFIATLSIAASYALLKRVFAAPVIEIGNDGVVVRTGLRAIRVAKNELNAVTYRSFGMPVVLERKNGKDIGVNAVIVDDERKEAVARVADERLFSTSSPPDRAAAFERAGRDVGAWRAQLRTALDGGYRAAGASVDDAAAVLASSAASSEQRIGAALALRIAGEPPDRVRVAAEGAIDPRMRVALEAIADDADDVRVERALKRLRR